MLVVGRLTPHKGIDRLITALPRDASLTIAGTGGHDPDPPECDYPSHLRRLARGRDVRFAGAVDDAALAGLYRRAAVVAVPSVEVTCYGRTIAVSELLGLTAIEAMASGTPVVASRLGGLAEVVVDGETGFLVEPGDTDELGARLRGAVGRPGSGPGGWATRHAAWCSSATRGMPVLADAWSPIASCCDRHPGRSVAR